MPAPKKRGASPISAHELRYKSYLAQVDPRTFLKALRGGRVGPMPRSRIKRVLLEAGMEHLLPADE